MEALRQYSTGVRSADLEFLQGRPFFFVCNRTLKRGWTPERLFKACGTTDLEEIIGIVIRASVSNLNTVLHLVESWRCYGLPVTVELILHDRRPAIGDGNVNTFHGLDVEDCYLPARGKWRPAPELHSFFVKLFADDTGITVVCADQ